MIQPWSFLAFIICINLQTSLGSVLLQAPYPYIASSVPATWPNSIFALKSYHYSDGSVVRPILIRGNKSAAGFGCGFFCNGFCDSYLFAIFIIQMNTALDIDMRYLGYPQVVWSANRNNPVKVNATLQLNSVGDFILRDVGGELVWSTNTARMSVSAINLTESGNLLLVNVNGSVVWQSFDYPTDSIVPRQFVSQGLKFRASVSSTNFSEGLYSLLISGVSYLFYIESDPPIIYHSSPFPMHTSISYGGSINYYIKLLPDGHLRMYENRETEWVDSGDYLGRMPNNCEYPMVCGEYGVCQKGQCSCPLSAYLTQINSTQPNLGCSQITPITCNASHIHGLVEVKGTRYFTFRADVNNTDPNRCKEACLSNCSCKASMFRYGSNPSIGDCYLPTQIFSLIHTNDGQNDYNFSVFLKVQQSNKPGSSSSRVASIPLVLGSTLVGLISLFLIGVLIVLMIRKRRHDDVLDMDCVNIAPGMPARFSFVDLKLATHNFNLKLGEGAFGCVYKGSLEDGTKVAVKCVDGIGRKNSFLTEVGSIGNIHHVNLVRLVGYCAEKSHRLLVYEYMVNGSLDNWIYDKEGQENTLDWKCRKKIVVDIAKGLTYLHEDCSQKVIHLDIKPQNILLDENFNARLADFGISKLLSRDQSKVLTTFRGTPGYMAPEWLSSIITEKADVYSFGVVVMEIVCGRRVFDCSVSAFDPMHLLSVLNKHAMEGKWLDMVSCCSDDMKSNEAEVVKMMQVASWCLQNDFSSRPSMSAVVKVLEGVADVDLTNLDYNFISPMIYAPCFPESHFLDHTTLHFPQVFEDDDTLHFPEVLSGPR